METCTSLVMHWRSVLKSTMTTKCYLPDPIEDDNLLGGRDHDDINEVTDEKSNKGGEEDSISDDEDYDSDESKGSNESDDDVDGRSSSEVHGSIYM